MSLTQFAAMVRGAVVRARGYSAVGSTDLGVADDMDSVAGPGIGKQGPVGQVLAALTPTFLAAHGKGAGHKRPHASAWLDGLRGVAALFVVLHHASLVWWGWDPHKGFGSPTEKPNNLIIQLPILRLLISGPPQVAVFFVVSGYALSYKPLRLSRTRGTASGGRINDALASAAFRRYMRLYVPATVALFVSLLFTCFGWFAPRGWDGVVQPSREPPLADSLSGQVWHWILQLENLANPLNNNEARGNNYDMNLWTLPVEFYNSMVVFIVLLAFSRLRPLIRTVLIFSLIVYSHYHLYNEKFLFLSGMLLCDLRLWLEPSSGTQSRLAEEPSLSLETNGRDGWTTEKQRGPFPPWVRKALWTASFFMCLHILSMPSWELARTEETPGFRTLASWIPSHFRGEHRENKFWVPLAAVWLVFTVDRAAWLQCIFTTTLAQYLGRISFGLYLVHGTIIWTLGLHSARIITSYTGTETNGAYGLGIFLAACITGPVVFWAADMLTKIDERAVSSVRTMYAVLTREEEEKEEEPKIM